MPTASWLHITEAASVRPEGLWYLILKGCPLDPFRRQPFSVLNHVQQLQGSEASVGGVGAWGWGKGSVCGCLSFPLFSLATTAKTDCNTVVTWDWIPAQVCGMKQKLFPPAP